MDIEQRKIETFNRCFERAINKVERRMEIVDQIRAKAKTPEPKAYRSVKDDLENPQSLN
jgi:nitrogen fixation/metabolism regulation signal transduction histidine kinase